MNKVFLIFALIFTATFVYADGMAGNQNPNTTPSGIRYDKLEPEIDSFVAKYLYKSTPGVAVILTKDNDIIFSKSYGYADIESKRPINLNTTIFEYGSVTKLFIWLSVLQLVEDGKIDLDKDIKDYLPADFADKLHYEDTITIFDLMNHTAGFEERIFDISFKDNSDFIPLDKLLIIAEPKQIYKPGTTIAYSNYGACLVAFIVESVSGKKFYDYVNDNILKPVGMQNTVIDPLANNDHIKNNLATGYMLDKKNKFQKAPHINIGLYPAGSAKGSASDLAKFVIALNASNQDENKLTKSLATLDYAFAQSYTPHLKIISLAHGFWGYAGKAYGVGHIGNTVANTANFYLFPKEKLGIVILANSANEFDITFGLIDLIIGKESKILPEKDLPDSSILSGEYIFARHDSSTVMSILHYANLIKVQSTSANEIELKRKGNHISKYKQIEPYLFDLISSDDPLIKNMFSRIYFKVENNKVLNISGGMITDFVPADDYKSGKYIKLTFIIEIISLLFFIIAPIILIVKAIKNRFKQYNNLHSFIQSILIFDGTALVINNLLILSILYSSTKTFVIHFSSLMPYIMVNKILIIFGIILSIAGIINLSRSGIIFRKKFLYIILVIIFFLFSLILFWWNFV